MMPRLMSWVSRAAEGAAGEVGVDQGLVDLARLGEGRKDRLLGDGVEGHALDLEALLDRLLLLEDVQKVPGNGLPFAIGVGGQDQLVGLLHGLGDLANDLLGAEIGRASCRERV